MIRAVIFDMDGVLIDAREWHFEALNRALGLFGYEINRAEHLTTFDGLPTRRKLEILTITRGFPAGLHGFVNELKQSYTMDLVHARCRPTFAHQYLLSRLRERGLKTAVASNSIRATVEAMMDRSKLAQFLEVMLSNEDVSRAKPDPEIYRAAMERLGVRPDEALIVEDNEHGIAAAKASGAQVLVIRDPSELKWDLVQRALNGERGRAQ